MTRSADYSMFFIAEQFYKNVLPVYVQDAAAGRPLYIEIGCGKGKFISELAEREPEHFFVAIEGNKSVMLRAMEKNTVAVYSPVLLLASCIAS